MKSVALIRFVEVFNVCFDTALKKKIVNNRLFAAVIGKDYMNACAEESLLAKS